MPPHPVHRVSSKTNTYLLSKKSFLSAIQKWMKNDPFVIFFEECGDCEYKRRRRRVRVAMSYKMCCSRGICEKQTSQRNTRQRILFTAWFRQKRTKKHEKENEWVKETSTTALWPHLTHECIHFGRTWTSEMRKKKPNIMSQFHHKEMKWIALGVHIQIMLRAWSKWYQTQNLQSVQRGTRAWRIQQPHGLAMSEKPTKATWLFYDNVPWTNIWLQTFRKSE